jgi:hypothetical protein
VSSLHNGQYPGREERPALQRAGAPQPDGKMQLPLLQPPKEETCAVLDQLHFDPGVGERVSRQYLWQNSLDELRHCPDAQHSSFTAGEGSRTLP